MTIEYNFEIKDWLKFNDSVTRASKQFKRSKLILTLFLPVLSLVLMTIDIINGRFNEITFTVLLILSTIWIFWYPKRLEKRITKQGKKLIENGDNSGVLGLNKLIIEDEGIIHITNNSEQKLKWNGVVKFQETDTHLYLFNSSISAIVVNKNLISGNIDDAIKRIKENVA